MKTPDLWKQVIFLLYTKTQQWFERGVATFHFAGVVERIVPCHGLEFLYNWAESSRTHKIISFKNQSQLYWNCHDFNKLVSSRIHNQQPTSIKDIQPEFYRL